MLDDINFELSFGLEREREKKSGFTLLGTQNTLLCYRQLDYVAEFHKLGFEIFLCQNI